ncbi:MAG: RES family NAD+ phosphorylase [Gammaproteobacteria bacterium]
MIWQACRGAEHIGPLAGEMFRLVESQAQVATLAYVDTLAEQALLEDLLEAVKPPWPADSARLHYLLRTPFRYPPLPWGSRFGQRHEPALCYGGRSVEVTLAEVAYYRLVFRESMDGPAPAETIRTEHTLFAARYRTGAGVALQGPAFASQVDVIRHPSDYRATQALGAAMREAGVEAFEYPSARAPEGGCCVGLFTPAAFSERRPRTTRQWLCELGAATVAFKPVGGAEVLRFERAAFLVEGRLPLPA